jgi:hypothetical protein
MAKTSLNITESNAVIQKRINVALARPLNKKLQAAARKIKSAVSPVIEAALLSSPEMSSVSSGSLRAEFGLEADPSSEIVSAIVGSLDVVVDPVDRNLNGGVTLVVQPKSFANLLSLSSAEQPINGGSIPWLRWLLTVGDSVIIADFGVEFGPHGRSGGGRMSPNFAPYKVPSSFSGTADDNFITRAIGRVFPEIQSIIRRAF